MCVYVFVCRRTCLSANTALLHIPVCVSLFECVCVCVCMCVCVCVCKGVCVCLCGESVCLFVCVFVWRGKGVCMFSRVSMCVYLRMFVCVSVYVTHALLRLLASAFQRCSGV